MGFSRQEYWSGLPCPAPGDIPTPGIKPASPVAPTFQADSLPFELQLVKMVITKKANSGSDGNTHTSIFAWRIPMSRGAWWATAAAAAAAKSLQSCPTLCDPRDGSSPGSAIPGILQARTLEWVAISFSIWLPRTPQILPFLQDSHRTGRETTFGATQITPQSCLSTL